MGFLFRPVECQTEKRIFKRLKIFGGWSYPAAFLRFKGRVAELAAEVGWSSGRLSISEGARLMF